jgi:hypothetical protein
MPEGDDTSPFSPGPQQPGAGRRSERDLLSERRARRAEETGETTLVRRAEAAEATVQTLETHVATLQRRLSEAEQERDQVTELLELARAAAREGGHELKRVKQREYAEQQLRVEAEDRLADGEREHRIASERLGNRLSASEGKAAALEQELQDVRSELQQAQEAAAAQRMAVRDTELALHTRLGELERRAEQLNSGLLAERQARERSEGALADMRAGHSQMEEMLADLKQIVQRLTARLGVPLPLLSTPPPAPPRSPAASIQPGAPAAAGHVIPGARAPLPTFSRATMHDVFEEVRAVSATDPQSGADARGAEMADALAAAVERLRARAEAHVEVEPKPAAPVAQRVPHKHSMSLIRRLRNRRKQRSRR